jgi:hypothetical protein
MTPTVQITGARYLSDYKILINFSDQTSQTVDFENFLTQNPHPQHDKYKKFTHFKKFKVEHGNIVWGSDWDLIFPVEQLYKGEIE